MGDMGIVGYALVLAWSGLGWTGMGLLGGGGDDMVVVCWWRMRSFWMEEREKKGEGEREREKQLSLAAIDRLRIPWGWQSSRLKKEKKRGADSTTSGAFSRTRSMQANPDRLRRSSLYIIMEKKTPRCCICDEKVLRFKMRRLLSIG